VIVNGHCRWAAGGDPHIDGLRAVVHTDWGHLEMDRAIVIENVHRLDLNPLLLGRHLVAMLPDYGHSHRALAEALHKSRGWVDQRIALTKLAPELQARLEADDLPFALARDAGTHLHPRAQQALGRDRISIEVATQWIQARIPPDKQVLLLDHLENPPPPPPSPAPAPTEPPRFSGTAGGEGPTSAPEPITTTASDVEASVAAPPPLSLRLTHPTPATIADALVARLTPEDVETLIKALRKRLRTR
jgi:ParB family chromosome partitioning protein